MDFNSYREMINSGLNSIDMNSIDTGFNMIFDSIRNNRKIILFGNGGSQAVLNHWQCDFEKGLYNVSKELYSNCINLTSNPALITAITNDIGKEYMFSHQIEYIKDSDCLCICMSSSGNSINIVNGLKEARRKQYKSILICGFDGGVCKKESLADCIIHINTPVYGVHEDFCSMIMHYYQIGVFSIAKQL
jgi:D-sedoheptulose 7-phosphate isomerase